MNRNMRKATVRTAVFIVCVLLLPCAGCERPPRATEAVDNGPPKLVHVEPDSPEGKALAEARQKDHPNFVAHKQAETAATQEKPKSTTDGKQTAPSRPEPRPGIPTPPRSAPAPTEPRPAPGPTGAPSGSVARPAGAAVPAEGANRVTAASQTGRTAAEYGVGIISTPIGAYFSSKATIAVKIQLASELQTYATIHGPPRDFDELVAKVVKPAKINLPELRPGERYVFDPKQGPYGTLMIEQPAPQPK